MPMKLKQSFQRTQNKTVKDFFSAADKMKIKTKNEDDNNFFTQLIKRS